MNRILYLTTAIIIAATTSLFATDYSQSFISVEAFGGLGAPWGKIMDTEHKMMKITSTYTDGTTQTGSPEHLAYHFGVYLDLTPFRTSLTDSTNFLFGLRSIYTYNSVYQSIDLGGGSYEQKSWGGTYLEYNSLTFGPVVSFVFGNKDANSFITSFSIDLFVVGGPIFAGKLTPAVAAGDYDSKYKLSSVDMDGIKITGGIAAVIHWELFDFGLNMCYSNNMITTKDQVYTAIGKNTNYNEITFDLIFGFHY